MRIEEFKGSPVGDLVPMQVEEGGRTVDHWAFSPAHLPTAPALSLATMAAAIDAGHDLGRLDAIARELLPNPMLLARPTIRREAVSTSALEGTYAPAAEVLSAEVDTDRPRSAALTEILNFISATELGIERLRTMPICVRLAAELQGVLVRGTPSEDWQAGQVRQTQVIIGPYQGCSVKEAHFIPPPPGPLLVAGLEDWESWIHGAADVPPLIRIALAHYQFEALHPFTDGNGRIGRLLAILQLIDYGLLGEPLINLSPFFEANAGRYRHLLRLVSSEGSWDEWVIFFCEALSAQAKDAVQRIRDLLGWRDDTLEHLKRLRMKGVALDIVASLIESPTLSVKTVADQHSVTPQAANSAVARLVGIGVLAEATGRSYNRIFQAPEVLEILFRRTGTSSRGTA